MSSRHIQLSKRSEEDSLSKYDLNYGEYAVNWRNIIFLPFNNLWELLITCTVVLNAFVVVYDIAYDKEKLNEGVVYFIYYTCEIMYFFDTALVIAHRNMSGYRAIREHEPKKMGLLFVDIITLLPMYEIYLLLEATSRAKVNTIGVRNVIRVKSLFRLYRIYEYFSKMMYNAGINQLLVVCAGHYLKLVILTHLVGAFWYSLSCWMCKENNWSGSLKYHDFNPKNPMDWLIICYTTIGNAFAHNFRGNISTETPKEKTVIILVMLIGYVIHFMVYFGQLTRTYVKLFRRKFVFVDNLNRVRNLINKLDIEKEWEDKTMEYYNALWEKRSGIKKMPETFQLLPAPLQKEVTVDIFWEALRHSHLYGQEDISFKRALSLEMKSEFFLPGDYIYRLNTVKSKMVYIVSGILQVLTAEDEESPVISFSSGTVLGEMACLLPTKSIANVRCATYCELHTLSIYSLYRVLKNYPGKSGMFQEKLAERLQNAQEVYEYISLQPQKEAVEFEAITQDPSIKWIKRQWRHIAKYQYSTRRSEGAALKIDPAHSSEYLDLLVLSEEVELKMQVICLRGCCPFVLESDSSFRRFTHYLVIMAIITQCLMLPYHIAFKRRISGTLFSICFVMDLLYVLDLYLKMSTAIKTREVLIGACNKIVIERMKEISFLTDILATIPFDYIAVAVGTSSHAAALLKLNRLLKIYQVVGLITARERSIYMDSLQARLVKYCFTYVLTCYWFCCLMYAFACFHEECSYYGWYNYNKVLKQQQQKSGSSAAGISNAFITTLFYVLSTYLSVAISSLFEYTAVDILAKHFIVMISYYLFSYCYSGLCATFVLRLEKQQNYRSYFLNMTDFLKVNKITGSLKLRVMNMLNFWWYYNNNVDVFGEKGILEDATPDMKDKIVKQRIRDNIEKVPLFSKCDDRIINKVIKISAMKTLPAGAQIITAGYRPTRMNVVVRGYCEMKSIMAGDYERDTVTILKSGDAFPVIEFLHQVPSLTNVTAVTAVEIVCIRHGDLIKLFLANPSFKREVTSTLEHHYSLYEAPLLRKKGRLPEMIPAEHSLGQGDMFTFEIYDDDELDPEETAYLKPFKKLGKWSFLRYGLCRHTVNPHKKFFICWEISRCVFAAMHAFLSLTYFNLLREYNVITYPLLRFFDLTAVLDFYVRLHCQYYNEKGIVVTHPWATAKNYVKTSFVIDLIATLPYRVLQVDQILGYKHRETVYTALAVITRPWQLYRSLGFINYLQSNIRRSLLLLQAIKYTVLIAVLLASVTLIIQMITCDIEPPDAKGHVKVFCKEESWIRATLFKETLRPIIVYVQCLYVAVTIFTGSSSGTIAIVNQKEAYLFVTLLIVTFVLRALVYAKVTSDRIGGNVNLTIFQERMKSFINFVKAESIDEDLIQHMIDHYQYIWKKTQGSNITHTLKKFHINLHQEVAYTLYGSTLEAADLFQGADDSFFRQFGIYLQVQHFNKDSEIVRCNDVQGLVFIVYKGKVDITIAGLKVCTLGQGGIFGCIEKQGITRQTISATAKVHVELLVINSKQFHAIITKSINSTDRLRQSNFFHSEYAESKKRVIFDSQTSRSRISSSASVVKNWALKFYHKILVLIKPEDSWYKLWQYILHVHVASISSLAFMFYIVMSKKHTEIELYAKAIIYVLDILFIINIYFKFHLAYVDTESGILIRDHHLIQMKYLKSYKFWFDVITCFPFEIFTGFMTSNLQVIRYSIGNRTLRFVYLVQYYQYCEEKLHVRRHLRWTYLTYLICINIQFGTCVWWLAACGNNHCYYVKSTDFKDRLTHVKANAGIDSILLAYQYVVNVFTNTGLQNVNPMTKAQIIVSILLMCAFQYTAIALASEFATMLSIEQFTMSNYEHNIQQLRTYLKDRELSPPIVDKVWTYSLQLWQRQRGEWMPFLITEAPGYLKQDLMMALYGTHLHNHFLFAHTHVDFIRQLVVHLQRCVFFPGNYLAEQGDLDGSMYFIHAGEVEVYDKHGNNDLLRMVLKKKNSFGESQGLYNIPHEFSYKARTVVDALILRQKDWKYLLKWFPASHEEIDHQAAEYALKRESTNEQTKRKMSSSETVKTSLQNRYSLFKQDEDDEL